MAHDNQHLSSKSILPGCMSLQQLRLDLARICAEKHGLHVPDGNDSMYTPREGLSF